MQRRHLLTLPCALALAPLRAAEVRAAAVGRVTLVDGAATLHVGAQAQRAVVGRALPAGTLVDTGATCLLLRIEWPDGSALDLGPATLAVLAPPALPGLAAGAFHLLQGWAKFSAAAPGHGWATPLLAAAPSPGVAVVSVDPAQTLLFAETGQWTVTERPGGQRQTLPPTTALRAVPGRPAERLSRAPADWLPGVPKAFRDTLPRRLATLPAAEPAAEALPPADYATLKPWLTAEPALRRDLPRRFAARLADGEFRAAIQANLRQHPEWAALLKPPAPRPKASPPSAAVASVVAITA